MRSSMVALFYATPEHSYPKSYRREFLDPGYSGPQFQLRRHHRRDFVERGGKQLRGFGQRLVIGARPRAARPPHRNSTRMVWRTFRSCAGGWDRSRRWRARAFRRRRCGRALRSKRCAACLRVPRACAGRAPPPASSNPTTTGPVLADDALARRSASRIAAASTARLPDRWWSSPRPGGSSRYAVRTSPRRRPRAGAGRCAAACGRSGASNRWRTRPAPARERRGEPVGDALAFVDHLEHGDAGDGAGIEGLAAGGGIEGGAVEVDGKPVGRIATMRAR